eukprot:4041451-Pleurochrysis_carterae.AAC.1
MDDHANRVLAYIAQNADDGIEYKTQGRAQLVAYSDSDWTVSHSTTGFCIMYGGAAVSSGSKRQHCISLSSTEAEIVANSRRFAHRRRNHLPQRPARGDGARGGARNSH